MLCLQTAARKNLVIQQPRSLPGVNISQGRFCLSVLLCDGNPHTEPIASWDIMSSLKMHIYKKKQHFSWAALRDKLNKAQFDCCMTAE